MAASNAKAERKAAEKAVETWNGAVKPFAPVRYYPVQGKPEYRDTYTEGLAFVDLGGQPAVQVLGVRGHVHLDNLEAL